MTNAAIYTGPLTHRRSLFCFECTCRIRMHTCRCFVIIKWRYLVLVTVAAYTSLSLDRLVFLADK